MTVRERIVLKQALVSCALAMCCAIGFALAIGMRKSQPAYALAPTTFVTEPMDDAPAAPKHDYGDFGQPATRTPAALVDARNAPDPDRLQNVTVPSAHPAHNRATSRARVENDICAAHHLHRVDYTRNGWPYWKCAK